MIELSKDYGKVENLILGSYVEPVRPRYPTREDLAIDAAEYVGKPPKLKKESKAEKKKTLDLPTSAVRRSPRLNSNTIIIGGVEVDVPDTEHRAEAVEVDDSDSNDDEDRDTKWKEEMKREVDRLEREVQVVFKTHYDKYERQMEKLTEYKQKFTLVLLQGMSSAMKDRCALDPRWADSVRENEVDVVWSVIEKTCQTEGLDTYRDLRTEFVRFEQKNMSLEAYTSEFEQRRTDLKKGGY